MFLPSEMRARAYMMASSTTTLPAVFATISSASRMGTPEESSVPSVRVKRATAILRSTSPMTGKRRSVLWRSFLPFGVRVRS